MTGEEPHELEEGEALDCNYDDYNVDLSYIGDKVQSILGHFQKDFEGDISAENLGARYGGYGSFLPMHQRSPHRPQSRAPARVEYPNFPGSPNHIPTESFGRNSSILVKTGPAPGALGTCPALPQDSSQGPIASSRNASVQQKSVANVDRIPGIVEQQSRNNLLKFRFKVPPPEVLAEYGRLGLTTPSISGESSSEETVGSPVESHESHDESPAKIIQMMTSFPDSMLLSPLCVELLNKFKGTDLLVEGDYVAKSSIISDRPLTTNTFRFKKQETIGGGEKLENSLNRCNGKTLGRSIPECLTSLHDSDDKHMPDLVTEPEQDIQLRNKRGSKCGVKEEPELNDSVKGVSLAHTSEKSFCKLEQQNLRCKSADKILKNQARISENNNLVDDGQPQGSSCDRKLAAVRAHCDTSDGKRVKGAINKMTAKVGRGSSFGGVDDLGSGHSVDNFIPEKKSIVRQSSGKHVPNIAVSLQDRGCDAPKNRNIDKKVHLGKTELTDRSSKHVENIELAPERLPSGWPKSSNLEPSKTKPKQAVKLKDISTTQQYLGGPASVACMMEPPVADISSNGGINADKLKWVQCESDSCEKWRILPYDRNIADLPEKWFCRMLDWLPGMNRCDVSEDETNSYDAVLWTYPSDPVSVDQYDNQAHAVNTNGGGSSAGFSQNSENFNSGHFCNRVKKQKLKEEQMYTGLFGSKKNLQRPTLKTGGYVKSTLDLQDPNNFGTEVPKLKKRKNEHVIDGDINPSKRIKKESIGVPNHVNFQKSGEIVVTGGHALISGLSNKAAMEDVKSENTQLTYMQDVKKDDTKKGKGKIQIHFKKPQHQMQDLPNDRALSIKASKSTRLIKDHEDVQHQVQTPKKSGSYLQLGKASIHERKDGEFYRDKKPRVPQVEDKESKRGNLFPISKTKGVAQRDRLQGNKDCTPDQDIDIEQQVRKNRVKGSITHEDCVKLKQDLGYGELPTTATSTSSKISGTRRNKIRSMDTRSSPGESVSSSPARIAYSSQHHVSPIMMVNEVKTNSGFSDISARSHVKKSLNVIGSSEMRIPRNGISAGASCRSYTNPVLDFREPEARKSSRELASGVYCGHNKEGLSKSDINTVLYSKPENDVGGSTTKKISHQMVQLNDGLCTDLCQTDKNSAHYPSKYASGFTLSEKSISKNSRPSETSVDDNSSKYLKDTVISCHQNEADKSLALESKFSNNKTPNGVALKKAKSILSEAERLRNHADLIKKSNVGPESNYCYFQAALKFLLGASLLEVCDVGSGKNMVSNSIDAYGTAAGLCKTCAVKYQKDHEVAAALAYKCVEVACMRIVLIKSSTSATQRVWHDLQSSVRIATQGESPSSSASDVDNLNNLATAAKVTWLKGNVSHTRNHNIVARNNPNLLQLLDFTKYTTSAMEAAKKSKVMFEVACEKLEDSLDKEAIDSVKSVLNMGFQDVDEFIHLVSNAFSAIGLSGRRD